MLKSTALLGFILLNMAFVTAHAKPLQATQHEFGKPIQAFVLIKNNSQSRMPNLAARNAPTRMKVYLMNIKLAPQQKRKLGSYPASDDTASYLASSSRLPSKVELGMNNVPVLNQGLHGACTTFAVTAALDAILNKGDFISELCTLQLGEYLSRRSYSMSGWEGSLNPFILNRYLEYGYVSKADQSFYGCGGLKDYPVDDEDYIGDEMTPEDYFHISQDLRDDVHWYSLLTPYQRFYMPYASTNTPNQLIGAIKQSLARKDAQTSSRVLVSVLLPVAYCSAGACGKLHESNDTWTITNSIRADANPDIGGHAMIITGYDDDAIVTDEEGGRHKGVFILRNSWSEKAGDHGDFYMTYEFFKHFIFSAEVVAYAPDNDENEEE